MGDRIIHKRSLTLGSVPTTSSLELGELAINVADGKLYLRRSGSINNDVVSLVTANTITTGSIRATAGFTGSLFGTASWAENAQSSSYVNTLFQDLSIFGNLNIYGTASFTQITGSTLQAGTSVLVLNTDFPAVRFGGISVVDSGSFGNASTGSLFWDSLNNRWVYSNPSGSSYDGGLLISGPRNTSGLGNETGMDSNFVAVGQGSDHIRPGSIFNSGSITIVTGSLTATEGISGSFSGSGANLSNIPASAIVGLNLNQIASGSVSASISPNLGLQINTNVTATSFTGSVFGTASNAVSSSFATIAQNAPLYVLTSTTASMSVATASFVQNAQSASYVLNAVSSSFATSASFASTVPASGVIGLNLSQIASGSATASISPNFGLQVNTRTTITSSANTISGSVLTVYGTGSALPVFTVQGSQGELFSITDSLTGSLFSVNDISGLPILETFSDGTTLIGNYLSPMLLTTARVAQTNSGSFTVYSLPTASYDTAFFEYSVRSGSNARAGTIMAVRSGSSVNFTETTTTEFGSTSAVSFTMIVTGSNFALTGSSTTGAWTIKSIVRGL